MSAQRPAPARRRARCRNAHARLWTATNELDRFGRQRQVEVLQGDLLAVPVHLDRVRVLILLVRDREEPEPDELVGIARVDALFFDVLEHGVLVGMLREIGEIARRRVDARRLGAALDLDLVCEVVPEL